jgi:hypothetical protein
VIRFAHPVPRFADDECDFNGCTKSPTAQILWSKSREIAKRGDVTEIEQYDYCLAHATKFIVRYGKDRT